ncbi:MAG: tetratricopeptide repeat protein [Myxococcota bacterium]
MRHRWPGLIALGLALSVSTALAADEDKKSDADKSADKESAADTKERKDPKGVQGISPFMELLNEGNAAYIARDYAGAVAKYQEALQKEPSRALGHYMLGQAFLADGKLQEADSAWQSALRYAEKEPVLKAKTLFVIADLRERQGQWEEATQAWQAYAQFVGANPNANGYPATATERQKAIETRKDLAAKYAEVKKRIAQREKDAAAKAKK